jgi:mono/diheme cytochrome c family protein
MRAWRSCATVILSVLAGGGLATSGLAGRAQSDDPVAAANAAGWQIPSTALGEHSPLMPTPGVLKRGKDLFGSNCQKCHGPEGRGNGPYADPDHPPADLTASTSADGVMFYKVWNGRKAPTMPAFKSQLTKDEIWTVIEYAKSLRK